MLSRKGNEEGEGTGRRKEKQKEETMEHWNEMSVFLTSGVTSLRTLKDPGSSTCSARVTTCAVSKAHTGVGRPAAGGATLGEQASAAVPSATFRRDSGHCIPLTLLVPLQSPHWLLARPWCSPLLDVTIWR